MKENEFTKQHERNRFMTIKWRLKLSYVLMLVIPFGFIMCTGWILSKVIEYDKEYLFLNKIDPAEQALRFNQRVLGMINRQILEDVDRFNDIDFIMQLEKQIQSENAGLIVRKNNDILYMPEAVKNNGDDLHLISFKEIETEDQQVCNRYGRFIIMRLYDFYFSDGSQGSIFLSFNIGNIIKNAKTYQKIFIFLFGVIFIISNGVLTISVYRSIITPLKRLEAAANSIRDGNLNDSIRNYSNDEFGEVMKAFEEMRKKLKDSQQLQRQYEENRKILISNISHDLKTPITSIKGYVEGIKDGVADTPEKMEKYINTIYKKASDMDVLIDNLLLFSKLDLQKYPFDFHHFNIIDYMKDIIEEMRFDFEKEDIRLNLHCPNKKIFVKGDVNNLRRVIINIMDNSMKYAGNYPLVIDVYIKERIDDVLIEIRDNGKGIPDNELPYIFDRFYRADPSRNTNIVGNGLGLAIVKKIIEEHDGMIWAESKIDVGTGIFFTLRKVSQEVSYEKSTNY